MSVPKVLPPPRVLILVAFLFGATFAVLRSTWADPIDFDLFWMVGRHPSEAYDPALMHGQYAAEYWWPEVLRHVRLPFAYPPTTMLLWWPLSRLPMNVAFVLFSGASAALFMALCVRRVGWLAALSLFSLPLAYSAFIGQVGLMISCAVIAAFEMIGRRPRLAGAILAAIVCIKPQSAIVVPFVLWGRWEAVKAGMLAGVALIVCSLLFGPKLWIEWLHSLNQFKSVAEAIVPRIMPYSLLDGAIWWRIFLVIVGIVFATWERGFTGFFVGSLLCSPYFQLYDLAGFSFLGLLILSDWRRLGPLKGLVAGMFGLILVACPAYPETTTLFCAALIGLRVFASRIRVGKAIEFAPPRTILPLRFAAPEGVGQ